MEHVNSLLLTFLEMTFIFVGLGLLYSQRRAIGKTPFYMSVGLLLLFSHFVIAAEIKALLWNGMYFDVGKVVIFLPVLFAYLMVYITEGTLAAQRILIGAAVLFGLYLYLGELTRLQCNWLGFSLTSGADAAMFDSLLSGTRVSMNVAALTHLFDLLVMPIFYTRLKNFGAGRFVSLGGAGFATLLLGTILMQLLGLSFGFQIRFIDGNFFARIFATVWLAALLTLYLNKIEGEIKTNETSPLDILFAFVGSYGRSKELEANLQEWTNRYQLVLENAGEMIVMLNCGGKIIDANYSAARILGSEKPGDLVNRLLFPRMRILDDPDLRLGGDLDAPVRFQCALDEHSVNSKLLSCSLSPIRAKGQTLLVLIARDITEEIRLAEEKARLSEQLVHSQRIEALGMLAGGIAHDFNNYVHAILGHIDVINFMHEPENPEVLRHLEKITAIAEQAGTLTNQLLGFARKGKYQVSDVRLQELLPNSLTLLGPRKQRDVEVVLEVPDDLPPLRADALQLQQVMLNLMINALDAMELNSGGCRLTVRAGRAPDAPVDFEPPPEHANARLAEYLYIEVSDNGSGMDRETRRKIFEPFFTTKPVGKGTGMGLAMVYGTVSNHQGWIQLKSTPGKGTSFFLFLPVPVEPEGDAGAERESGAATEPESGAAAETEVS